MANDYHAGITVSVNTKQAAADLEALQSDLNKFENKYKHTTLSIDLDDFQRAISSIKQVKAAMDELDRNDPTKDALWRSANAQLQDVLQSFDGLRAKLSDGSIVSGIENIAGALNSMTSLDGIPMLEGRIEAIRDRLRELHATLVDNSFYNDQLGASYAGGIDNLFDLGERIDELREYDSLLREISDVIPRGQRREFESRTDIASAIYQLQAAKNAADELGLSWEQLIERQRMLSQVSDYYGTDFSDVSTDTSIRERIADLQDYTDRQRIVLDEIRNNRELFSFDDYWDQENSISENIKHAEADIATLRKMAGDASGSFDASGIISHLSDITNELSQIKTLLSTDSSFFDELGQRGAQSLEPIKEQLRQIAELSASLNQKSFSMTQIVSGSGQSALELQEYRYAVQQFYQDTVDAAVELQKLSVNNQTFKDFADQAKQAGFSIGETLSQMQNSLGNVDFAKKLSSTDLVTIAGQVEQFASKIRSYIAEINRIAGKDVLSATGLEMPRVAQKTADAVKKESDAFRQEDSALSSHEERMQAAAEVEQEKLDVSRRLANALEAERTALNKTDNADAARGAGVFSDKHVPVTVDIVNLEEVKAALAEIETARIVHIDVEWKATDTQAYTDSIREALKAEEEYINGTRFSTAMSENQRAISNAIQALDEYQQSLKLHVNSDEYAGITKEMLKQAQTAGKYAAAQKKIVELKVAEEKLREATEKANSAASKAQKDQADAMEALFKAQQAANKAAKQKETDSQAAYLKWASLLQTIDNPGKSVNMFAVNADEVEIAITKIRTLLADAGLPKLQLDWSQPPEKIVEQMEELVGKLGEKQIEAIQNAERLWKSIIKAPGVMTNAAGQTSADKIYKQLAADAKKFSGIRLVGADAQDVNAYEQALSNLLATIERLQSAGALNLHAEELEGAQAEANKLREIVEKISIGQAPGMIGNKLTNDEMSSLEAKLNNVYVKNRKVIDSNKLLSASYTNLSNDLRNGVIGTVEQGSDAINRFTNMIRTAGQSASQVLVSVVNRLGNYAFRSIGFMAIGWVRNSISQVIGSIKEIDAAMTQLRIVTGASDAQMQKFFASSTEMAKRLGQSITSIASSVEVFSRLGYSLNEAAILAENATTLSNVAAVDVDAATTGLTSIIKSFGMQVQESEHVADVLVDVGQKYAISAAELMSAFERGGAAMAATGLSFDKSTALFAAANASLQNAEKVGTALQTVSARIRGSKSDLEELGEDYTDVADGISKYRDELKALTGFDIIKAGTENEFKDLYDIFNGIAVAWKNLSDTSQARVAEILGGTRQLSVISSIITNIADANKALETAENATGAAAEANAIYMDSIAGAVGRFNAQMQELSNTFKTGNVLQNIIDLGTGILKVLTVINQTKFLLFGLIPLVVSLLTLLKDVSRHANSKIFLAQAAEIELDKAGVQRLKDAFVLLDRAEQKIVLQTLAANGQFEALRNELDKLTVSGAGAAAKAGHLKAAGLGVSGVVGIIIAAMSILLPIIIHSIKTLDDWQSDLEESQAKLDEMTSSLETNIERIQELNKIKNGEDSSQEWSKELQDELDLLEAQNEQLRLRIQYQESEKTRQQGKVDRATWNKWYRKGYIEDNTISNWQKFLRDFTWTSPEAAGVGGISFDDLLEARQQLVQNLASGAINTTEFFNGIDELDSQFESRRELWAKDIEDLQEDVDKMAAGTAKDALQAVLDGFYEDVELWENNVPSITDALSDSLLSMSEASVGEILQQNAYRKLEQAEAEYVDVMSRAHTAAQKEAAKAVVVQARKDFAEAKDGAADVVASAKRASSMIRELSDAMVNGTMKSGPYIEKLKDLYAILKALADAGLIEQDVVVTIQAELGELQVRRSEIANAIYKVSQDHADDFTGEGFRVSVDWFAVAEAAMDLGMSTEDVIAAMNELDWTGKHTTDTLIAGLDAASRSAEDLGKALSFETLDKTKKKFDSLAKAISDIKSDKAVSYSTLSGIVEEFKDVESIDAEAFAERIAANRDDLKAVTGIVNELCESYIEAEIAAGRFADGNADVVASMLKEVGVSNSVAIANQMVTKAKVQNAIKSNTLVDANGELNQTLWDEVSAMYGTADAAASAMRALTLFEIKQSLLSDNPVDMSSSINSLYALAYACGVTGSALEAFSSSVDQLQSINNRISIYTSWLSTETGEIGRAKLQQWINEAKSDLSDLYTSTFDEIFSKVKFPTWYPTDDDNSSKSPEKELKSEFDDEKDYYEFLIKQEEHYDDDLQTKIGYYKKIQELAHQTADAYRAMGYSDTSKEIRAMKEAWMEADDAINKLKDDAAEKERESIEKIVDAAKNLVKWELEQEIDALEDEIDAYKDIIDKKKALLDLTKEEEDHEKSVANKVKEIAKVQSRIDQLSLDDSREAQATRKKLEEELYDLQNDLADEQQEYAIDKQKDALDDEYDAYEKAHKREIELKKKELDSEEELYQAALARIGDDWESFYTDLKTWNLEYGDMIAIDLASAWDTARLAMEKYGSVYKALGVNDPNHTTSGGGSGGKVGGIGGGSTTPMNYLSSSPVPSTENSSSDSDVKEQRITQQSYIDAYDYVNAHGIVDPQRSKYAEELGLDPEIFQQYVSYRFKKRKSNPIANLPAYHTGGVVGSGSSTQEEVLALLQNGELVLDKRKQNTLTQMIDVAKLVSERLMQPINVDVDAVMRRVASRSKDYGDVRHSSMVFQPEIHVEINHNGTLSDDDAQRYGTTIADTVVDKLNDAFAKRGLSARGSALLKA